MKSQLGSNFTEVQIEDKYKTVARQHKKILDNNRPSGASRVTSTFADEFREIALLDDSLEPEIRMDTMSIEIKSGSGSSELPPADLIPKAGTSTGKSNQNDVQSETLEAFKQS